MQTFFYCNLDDELFFCFVFKLNFMSRKVKKALKTEARELILKMKNH